MKLSLTLLTTLAVMPLANAALYTLGNGTTSTAAGIQTSDAKVFRSGTTDGQTLGIAPQNVQTSAGPGIVSFGIFSTDDFSSVSNSGDLVALFTAFGNSVTFNAGGTGGSRSIFSSAQNTTIGTTFGGKNVYLFVGNGTTYGNSTEFLIAKADQTFNVADDTTNAVTPKLLTINPGNSTVLFGSEIANVFTTNTDASTTAGWSMAAPIPEPSAAILGALGALGLLRRRRI